MLVLASHYHSIIGGGGGGAGALRPLASVVGAVGRIGAFCPGRLRTGGHAGVRVQRLALVGPSRETGPRVYQCVICSVRALRARLPGTTGGPPEPRFPRLSIGDAGDDDAGDTVASPWPDVGGHGGHHTDNGAAAVLQSQSALVGGDLEISAD